MSRARRKIGVELARKPAIEEPDPAGARRKAIPRCDRMAADQPLVFQGNAVELDHLFPTSGLIFDHFRKCVWIAHLHVEAKALKLLLDTKTFSRLCKVILQTRDAIGRRFPRR